MHSDYYELDNGKQIVEYIYKYNLGFSYGNAAKYVCRAGRKEGNSAEKDSNKAIVYIMSSDEEFPIYKRLAMRAFNKLSFNDKTQFAEHHLADILKAIITFDEPAKIIKMILRYMRFRNINIDDKFSNFV